MKYLIGRLSLLAALSCVACDGCSRSAPFEILRTQEPNAPPAAPKSERAPQSLSLLERLGHCDVSHRGVLIDLGTPAADLRRSFSAGPFDDVVNSERGGKTYAAVFGRELSYSFWLQRPSPALSVALRGHAGLSERVSVYLDDERLGVVRLPTDGLAVVQAAAGKRALEPGRHTVTLRFAARKRGDGEQPYAELDWLWVGEAAQLTDNYAPPTLDDIVADVALGGEPRRSLVLRAPAVVRCALRAARAEQLRLTLGYWGNGRGTAQLRVIAEGEAPVVLVEHELQGSDEARWKAVDVDLSRFDGKLIALELAAVSGDDSGRIAFGEPRIETAALPASPTTPAQNVVVVVQSGLSRSALPPWGPAQGFRGLTELVRQGVTFNGYRTRSSSSSAALASLLTGLPPRLHRVEDATLRLPKSVFTLAEMLKEHGGHSAMFTGVPTSFRPFGFDRGWDRFVVVSPVLDLAASEPMSQAQSWLSEQIARAPEQKRLLVVHARGGHPPWDLSREVTAGLPPEEYAGVLEARRGGIILTQLRTRVSQGRARLRNEDWTRLRAMQAVTLREQDQVLARLIDTLQETGQWDRTLFVFVADVAMGDPPAVPFGIAPLSEDRLLAPLIVRFPRGQRAGEQVSAACTSEDITRTIIDALGLPMGPQITGENLLHAVQGREPLGGRPLVALLGNQFSTRWGPWLLLGEMGNVPRLCQLEVDPSCVSDLFAKHPIVVNSLWRSTFIAASQAPSAEREPVTLDEETRAALTVWGE